MIDADEARDIVEARRTACALYLLGTAAMTMALVLRAETAALRARQMGAIERARARGEVDGVPRLDPRDPLANAAVLGAALAAVPPPSGSGSPGASGESCTAAPRFFAVAVDGRTSRVRFGARQVCQLQTLKRISVAQPGH